MLLILSRLPASAMSFDWHSVRRLRNEASHPNRQTIVTPGMAVPVVEASANALTKLFEAA
jgi:hypothetical protein